MKVCAPEIALTLTEFARTAPPGREFQNSASLGETAPLLKSIVETEVPRGLPRTASSRIRAILVLRQ